MCLSLPCFMLVTIIWSLNLHRQNMSDQCLLTYACIFMNCFKNRLRSGGLASRCLRTAETHRSCIIQRQIQINRLGINTNRLNGAAAVGGAARHKYRHVIQADICSAISDYRVSTSRYGPQLQAYSIS